MTNSITTIDPDIQSREPVFSQRISSARSKLKEFVKVGIVSALLLTTQPAIDKVLKSVVHKIETEKKSKSELMVNGFKVSKKAGKRVILASNQSHSASELGAEENMSDSVPAYIVATLPIKKIIPMFGTTVIGILHDYSEEIIRQVKLDEELKQLGLSNFPEGTIVFNVRDKQENVLYIVCPSGRGMIRIRGPHEMSVGVSVYEFKSKVPSSVPNTLLNDGGFALFLEGNEILVVDSSNTIRPYGVSQQIGKNQGPFSIKSEIIDKFGECIIVEKNGSPIFALVLATKEPIFP